MILIEGARLASSLSRVRATIVTLLCLKAASNLETILKKVVKNTLAYFSIEFVRLASTANRVKTGIVTLLCLKGASNF